tara:strand:+ start:857 stop:2041 length:1185 start_codon:yes stop_codon:yes gene_type:complete
MGGGSGGSSAPTEQTVYSESLPPYVEPYFTRLLQRSEAESLQPYTPYGASRIAYFSPDELSAQAMTRGYAQAGTPEQFTQAQNILGGIDTSRDSQYAAGTFDTGYDPSVRTSGYQANVPTQGYQPIGFEQNISRFMSPYQQAVTDVAKREAIRTSDIQGEQTRGQAAQAGGLGGYREAILQAERERNLGQRLDDLQVTGGQRAFDAATRQLGLERAADLGAAQFGLQQEGLQEQAGQRQEQLQQQAFAFGEQAKQKAAQLGLSAQAQEEAARQAQERFGQSAFQLSGQLGQQVASGLGTLGEATQRDVQQRLAALTGIGSQQRALQQASLDIGYEDFLRQQDLPQQRLGFFSNILRGVPVQPQRTVSQFQQQPGLFQQALGLGLGGLGLYKGLS